MHFLQGDGMFENRPRYDGDQQWTDWMDKLDYCGQSAFCREFVMEKLYDNDLQEAAEYLHEVYIHRYDLHLN